MAHSIQKLIEQYSHAADLNEPASLDHFLADHDSLDPLEAHTLVLWQQTNSWRCGRCVSTEEYLEQFPQLFQERELVLDLIYSEYRLSLQRDPTTTLEPFEARFPEYAEELRQQVNFYEQFGSELLDDLLPEDEQEIIGSSSGLAHANELLDDSMPAKDPTIPGYRLIGELGRGGLAVVYLAEDVHLHRQVALKMLLAGQLASETLLRRLEAEGEAIARLQHPHIIQIFKVGQHDGHPYLVLEYANAGTLSQWMGRQPKTPRQAATIMQQLAEAVQFAHEKGILHRDLKPGNVLLHRLNASASSKSNRMATTANSDDISQFQLKIADFGLAKFIRDDAAECVGEAAEEQGQRAATITGDLLGTVAYMSPEQARGQVHKLSATTDIYSLGTILYELLTGRPPFMSTQPMEVLNQVLFEEPVKPSSLIPQIPRDLETICLKCLDKQADRRYASASQLADELGRYLSNQPILARRASSLEHSWRWCKRHPAKATAIGFALTFLVCLMGGLAVYTKLVRDRIEQVSAANNRERALRSEALDRLFESHLARANALQTSQHAEQRLSLSILHQAQQLDSAIKLGEDQTYRLRNSVLSALTLHDMQTDSEKYLSFDDKSYFFAVDKTGRILAIPHSSTQVALATTADAQIFSIVDAQETILDIALNADASLLAIRGEHLRIYALQQATAKLVLELPALAYAFSTIDNRALLTCNDQGMLLKINIDSSESVTVGQTFGQVRQIAQSPDGRSIAVQSDDRVDVLDSQDGHLHLRLPASEQHGFFNIAWNAGSTVLAVGMYHSGVQLWDVQERTKLRSLDFEGTPNFMCFDAMGSRIFVYRNWGSVLTVWNTTTGRCEFTQNNSLVRCIYPSEKGIEAWQFDHDNHLTHINFVLPSLCRVLPSIPRSAAQATGVWMTYNKDGTVIAMAKEGSLELFDTRSCALLARLIVGSCYAEFDPDDNLITLTSKGLHRWQKKESVAASEEEPGATIEYGPPEKLGDGGPFAPFAISPDNRWVAVSHSDRVELIPTTHDEASILLDHSDVRRIAFSPDNRYCVTGGWNSGQVIVWEMPTGKKVKQIDEAWPCLVRFSPDGKWLAIVSNEVALWRTDQWQPAWRRTFTGRATNGLNICFSPDSAQLAVSDALGQINLLSIADHGRDQATISSAQPSQIFEIAFSPNGDQLAYVHSAGANLWDLRTIHSELASRDLSWPGASPTKLATEVPTTQLPQDAQQKRIIFRQNELFRQMEAVQQVYRVQAALDNFDYQSARAAIDRAVELKLSSAKSCNELAWRLVTGPIEIRQPEVALELVERALSKKTVPEATRANYLNTLGVAQYRSGRFEAAHQTLLKSLAVQPPESQAFDLYFLSMCSSRRGDRSAARDFFDRAETLRAQYGSSTNLPWAKELAEFSQEAKPLLGYAE